MKHHTKEEYLKFFKHIEEEEDKKSILWDEISWWLYYAIYEDHCFTLKELKEKFPYLFE